MKKLFWPIVFILILVSYCTPNSENADSIPQTQVSTPAATASQTPNPIATATQDFASTPLPSASFTNEAQENQVLVQLAQLTIKGRAPKTGYDRDLFGSAWADVDRNGCDTRNDILQRDLTNITYRSGTGNCVVDSGDFYDPYTGTEFYFVKSTSGSSIEIDHIVSLSDAWQKGAQQWNSQTRKEFANDPLNLVATSQSANRAKSDSDAATWLPPNKGIRCSFVARQIAVKSAYQLWVTQAEYDAMLRILESCPDQPAASSGTLR